MLLYVDHHTTQRPITAEDNSSELQLEEFKVATKKCQLLASQYLCGRGTDCGLQF